MTQTSSLAQGTLSNQHAQLCESLTDYAMQHRATDAEIAVVEAQLGRYPRGMVAVGARCVCGTPLAVITRPLVEGKIPFPTTCYLTSPEAVKAMSHLEAVGQMNTFNDQLGADEDLRQGYLRAHHLYLAFRDAVAQALGDSQEHIQGTTAGGMPVRVKCLHALCAQSLVMGTGANPIGDAALELGRAEFSPTVCRCAIKLEKDA
jgi:hypothetical protein